MGPVSRCLGPLVPEPQLWQDPVPAVDHELIGEQDIACSQGQDPRIGTVRFATGFDRLGIGVHVPRIRQAGGANGARIRLAPQKDWEVNKPAELAKVLQTLETIQKDFNSAQSGGKQVSLADLIVLGGCAAVEEAAKKAGHDVQVPFSPGRTDASQEMTDVESFAVLEPNTDGFRNYFGHVHDRPAEELLVDRAHLLTLYRSGDDGACRRHAGPEYQRRVSSAWCVHEAP